MHYDCPNLDCEIDQDCVLDLIETEDGVVFGASAAALAMPKLTSQQIDMIISVVMTVQTAITGLFPNPFVAWSVGNAFEIVIQVLKLIKSRIPVTP